MPCRQPLLVAARMAAVTAALMFGAAQAQEAPPNNVDPASKKPMGFKIVTNDPGAPADKQRRWITASGQITADTPFVFDRFLKGNELNGLTIYFDSPGGSIVGGMRLGEALRRAGATVAIGRSTPIGPEPAKDSDALPRHQLLPARGICFSSCAYAFLGGKTRLIAPLASYGLHMFWPGDQMEGILSRKYAYGEIERAQRISANLAVYFQRVGADATLLQIASSAPPKGNIRRLSPREILQYRVAEIHLGPPAFAGSGQWGLSLDRKQARISGDGETTLQNGTNVVYTLEIGCADTPGFTNVRFDIAPKQQQARGAPLVVTRAMVMAGSKSGVLAQSNKDIVAHPATFPRRGSENPHAWIATAGTIPADVVAEAAQNNAVPLSVKVEDGKSSFDAPFATGNLRATYQDWAKACDRIVKGGNAIP